jgi:transcriptional regulator
MDTDINRWALAALLQLTQSSPPMHLDLLQGTLDLLVLQTLRHGPRHGYGIASFIADASNGTFRVLDGALYASLHRLERTGLVVAVWGTSDRGRRARFYELTGPGRVAARDEVRRWHRYSTGVARVMVAGRGNGGQSASEQEDAGDWADPDAESADEFTRPGVHGATPFPEDIDN